MSLLATAFLLSLLGSFGGVIVAASLLLFSDSIRKRIVPWLVSYAVGALLGVALLDLLPEALAELPAEQVLGTLLAGILTFFILEKLVLFRHCHTADCEVHDAAAALVLIGDGFHNFVDGAIIGAAVLTSVPLGINTAIAVAAHEIPQEVGDIGDPARGGVLANPRARAQPRLRRLGAGRSRRRIRRRSPSCRTLARTCSRSHRRASSTSRCRISSRTFIAASSTRTGPGRSSCSASASPPSCCSGG